MAHHRFGTTESRIVVGVNQEATEDARGAENGSKVKD